MNSRQRFALSPQRRRDHNSAHRVTVGRSYHALKRALSSALHSFNRIVRFPTGPVQYLDLGTTWDSPKQVEDGMAHWAGSAEVPLINETVGRRLAAAARKWPSKVAVKAGSQSLTYKELDERSDALACGLQSLGLEAGSRVAISLGNCMEYVVMLLACGKLGAISVLLNPAYTPEQAIAAMNHIGASCFLTSKHFTPPYKKPQSNLALLQKLLSNSEQQGTLSAAVPTLHIALVVDNGVVSDSCAELESTTDFHSLLASHKQSRLTNVFVEPESIMNLQFTSGTTSMPKAVSLTHRGLLNNARHIGQGMHFSASDVVCCPFPLFHCSGLVVGLLASIDFGATVVFPSESFNPTAVLESIKTDSPTILHGVPTMFEALLDLVSKSPEKIPQLSNLRTGLLGGCPLPAPLRARIHATLHLPELVNAYGMTELSPLATITDPVDAIERKLTTVGRAIPHCNIKVVSPEDPSRTLKTGEKGEILVSGYMVMPGYWKDDNRTAQAIHVEPGVGNSGNTRWMRTGDEGLIDRWGYVQITGRIKDIIIRGGENIYPPEIEVCLSQHSQIQSAAVVGLPDPRLGEVVAAFIMVSPDAVVDNSGDEFAHDLRNTNLEDMPLAPAQLKNDAENAESITPAHVRQYVQSHLAKHLVPKYVFWVSEMPLTGSGKVEKYKLRARGVQAVSS